MDGVVVGAGIFKAGRDELGADIAFAEVFFVHAIFLGCGILLSLIRESSLRSFDFWEVFDVGKALEVVVLGLESGVVGESDGVDYGVGEGELVFDEGIGGGYGDVLINWHPNAGKHGAGNFLSFFRRSLLEGYFTNFGDDDGWDDQIR